MPTQFNIKGQNIDGVQYAESWVINGLNSTAIEYAQKFGEYLVSPNNNKSEALTTSQIRNVYGEILRLKMKKEIDRTSILLLKPRMAYMTERKGTIGSKDFHKVIERGLNAVIDSTNNEELKKRFENFANFFEAILAYHRSFGGK